MEKPLRYEKRLVKSGGSYFLLIPLNWLRRKAKEITDKVEMLVYQNYIEIRPTKD